MEISDIQRGLEGFTERLSSQTYFGTYRAQGRDSFLVSDGLGTRANSIWKMAEYIVAYYDNKNENISQYLQGWKKLVKLYKNQYLIIALDNKGNWGMYDSDCNFMGGNDFIIDYLASKTKYKDKDLGSTIIKTLSTSLTATSISSFNQQLLTALRTKPFVLLAGISGTGKSRIVKELAYASCPSDLREPNNEPGNYCMIEVKPNWHDSTELLGYFSTISQKYMVTNFIRFVHKASLRKDVPFFVCLDEMNLAPVEQYFAEYLSVLESRKRLGGDVVTGQILKKDNFSKCDLLRKVTDGAGNSVFTENLYSEEDEVVINYLKDNGLSIPSNLFVIGTVNMDDTTHQFSRKVIDRAMTIEMNGGELMDMFGGSVKLDFCENPMPVDCFRPRYVNADEVIDAHSLCAEKIKELTVKRLKAVNESLSETPFQVSYRVLNELVICLGNLLDDNGYQGDGSDDDFEKMVADAVDNIAIMKILPRIEGDDQLLGDPDSNDCKLKQLQGKLGSKSSVKITEMISRLRNSSFTRFWA